MIQSTVRAQSHDNKLQLQKTILHTKVKEDTSCVVLPPFDRWQHRHCGPTKCKQRWPTRRCGMRVGH